MLTTLARLHMIAVTMVMCAAQIYVFMHLSQLRYDVKKSKIAALILWVTTSCISCMTCFALDMYRETWISLLTLTLPNVVFFYIVSQYRGIKFIVTYCISDISIAAIDFCLYLLSMLLDGDYLSTMIIRCAGMILWTFAIVGFTGDRYHKALDMLDKGWGLMMLVGICMYVLMSLLASYPTEIRYRPEDVPITILVLFVIELIILMLIRVIYSSLEVQERRVRERETELLLDMAQEQYRILSDNMECVREMKHDLKHHLLVMSQLLQDGRISELQAYLDVMDQNSDMALKPYGDNYTISVLATHYQNECEKNSIRFECNTQAPGEIKLPTASLTVILGNMWQNAYEACLELQSDKRYVKTDILYHEGRLILKCENSFNGCLCLDEHDDNLKSTKGENRGYGVDSISRLAKQHNGYCYFEHSENKFILTVILMEEREPECTI